MRKKNRNHKRLFFIYDFLLIIIISCLIILFGETFILKKTSKVYAQNETEIQFNFKEKVEPVYRELVSLLLQPNASQTNLIKAREVIEDLQIAELDNYFKDSCIIKPNPIQIDKIDQQAAIIYPIILSDRLEVILSIPNAPLRHYATHLPEEQIIQILQNLYFSFYAGSPKPNRLHLSQQVYNWLIRPAEPDLAKYNTKTVVFVLDGYLQSLPMAALYDGKNYLIEKYSIAISPGLQLFSEKLEKKQLNVLAMGITEARNGFSALPGVEVEIQQISRKIKTRILLNQQFTRSNLQDILKNNYFNVLHLATHGQFSSNSNQTFLLAWDGRIQVKDIDRLLKGWEKENLKPIELLVLSACQTAKGDRRAALGLAGLAVRSGARSTLATLWSVSDKFNAEFMPKFYEKLTEKQSNLSKAEALRQAQIDMINNPNYNHPYFWASYILIGNWL